MKLIRDLCAIVGAVYLALAALGSIDAIDLKTCVSNAGRCHITISKEQQ